jgi:hypothetical protein
LAVGEVAVKGSGADTSGFGDVIEGDVGSVTGEGLFGDLEDAVPVALRVDAGLARDGFCSLYGHGEEICNRRHSPVIYSNTEALSVFIVIAILMR